MAARPGPSKNRRGAERTPRVLVLSGPNLDRLGTREPQIYGSTTLPQIHTRLEQLASELGAGVECRQSAHEGALVEWIGAAGAEGFDAVVINPGAYSHTSIALLDAIQGAGVPVIEVHLSNPDAREPFRRRALTARACVGRVSGFGALSYELGLRAALERGAQRTTRSRSSRAASKTRRD